MPQQILRVVIKTGDIAKIEECSNRTASQTMSDMRVFFKKTNKRYKMTFIEYAIYVCIPIDELAPFRLIHSYSAA
jgi:hypothetical protein